MKTIFKILLFCLLIYKNNITSDIKNNNLFINFTKKNKALINKLTFFMNPIINLNFQIIDYIIVSKYKNNFKSSCKKNINLKNYTKLNKDNFNNAKLINILNSIQAKYGDYNLKLYYYTEKNDADTNITIAKNLPNSNIILINKKANLENQNIITSTKILLHEYAHKIYFDSNNKKQFIYKSEDITLIFCSILLTIIYFYKKNIIYLIGSLITFLYNLKLSLNIVNFTEHRAEKYAHEKMCKSCLEYLKENQTQSNENKAKGYFSNKDYKEIIIKNKNLICNFHKNNAEPNNFEQAIEANEILTLNNNNIKNT